MAGELRLQIRYLVVWNPLILMCLHFALHVVGLDRQAAAPAASPGLPAAPLLGLEDGADLLLNLTRLA